MILDCGASRIVGGEELAGGQSSFYKGADSFDIVHPLGPPPPEFMESDGRAGNILNFRQIRHVGSSAPRERRLAPINRASPRLPEISARQDTVSDDNNHDPPNHDDGRSLD